MYTEQTKTSWHVILGISSFIIALTIIVYLFFIPTFSNSRIEELQEYGLQTALLLASNISKTEGELSKTDHLVKALQKHSLKKQGSQFFRVSIIDRNVFKQSTDPDLLDQPVSSSLQNKIYSLVKDSYHADRMIYTYKGKQYHVIEILYPVIGMTSNGVQLQDIIEITYSYDYILNSMSSYVLWSAFVVLLTSLCLVFFFIFIFSLPQFQVYEGLKLLLQDDFNVRVPLKRRHFLVTAFNQVATKMEEMKKLVSTPSNKVEKQSFEISKSVTMRHFAAVHVCLYMKNFYKYIISNTKQDVNIILRSWITKIESVTHSQQGTIIGFLGDNMHISFEGYEKEAQAIRTAIALQSWLENQAKEQKLTIDQNLEFGIGIASSNLFMGRLANSVSRQSIIGRAFEQATICAQMASCGAIYAPSSFATSSPIPLEVEVVKDDILEQILQESAVLILGQNNHEEVKDQVKQETTFETSISDMLQETLSDVPLDIEVTDDLNLEQYETSSREKTT